MPAIDNTFIGAMLGIKSILDHSLCTTDGNRDVVNVIAGGGKSQYAGYNVIMASMVICRKTGGVKCMFYK